MEHYSTIISRNLKVCSHKQPYKEMIRVEVMLEFSSDTTSVQHHRASKKHLEVSNEKPAGGKDPVLPAVGRVTHWLYGDEHAGKVVSR